MTDPTPHPLPAQVPELAEDHADTVGDGGIEIDDEIVLPWWQHPLNFLTIVISVALIAGMLGWLTGDNGADTDTDPNDVDIGFLQDMREHHDQAVTMSFIFLQLVGTDPGLPTDARGIVLGQGIEIGRMVQLLRSFGATEANEGDTSMGWMGMPVPLGQMPGMATDAQLDDLAAAEGPQADQLFVELMINHHQGAIDMADYAATNAAVAEVRTLATAMRDNQRIEIVELQSMVD